MLVTLYGKHLRPLGPTATVPFIGRISEDPDCAEELRPCSIFLARNEGSLPAGFLGYFLTTGQGNDLTRNAFVLGEAMHHLADGDVVRVDPRQGRIRAIYRRRSESNSLLVTERCDNFCVMCSQPPKDEDDSWILRELFQVVPLISPETRELGVTGGEPALLGHGLLDLLRALEAALPRTSVHVLTNGRAFAHETRAQEIAATKHHDVMLGIPLYSDLPEEHDFVVQARGAFSETVRGIVNLRRHKVPVEIRMVVHAETYRRLPQFADFVSRNLRFVHHVAFMGLEPMGFGKTNHERLWIDPADYQDELARAVFTLKRAGMNVSIYNHQLCVLDPRLHSFQRRSISDWKNAFHHECDSCTRRTDCGGFFAPVTRRSRAIRPFITISANAPGSATQKGIDPQ